MGRLTSGTGSTTTHRIRIEGSEFLKKKNLFDRIFKGLLAPRLNLNLKRAHSSDTSRISTTTTAAASTSSHTEHANTETENAKRLKVAERKEETQVDQSWISTSSGSSGSRPSSTRRPSSGGGSGLYDFLPPPDPEKDEQAGKEMKEKHSYATGEMKKADQPSKVIFLDVDGVLRPVNRNYAVNCVSMDGIQIPLSEQSDFKSSALSALRHLREQTGAVLVLSSEWRRHPTLRDNLERVLRVQKVAPNGLTDQTTTEIPRELGTGDPVRSFAERRALEIGKYLRDHPHVEHWVCLDDIDLSVADDCPRNMSVRPAKMRGNFVRTCDQKCLTYSDAVRAAEILNRLESVDDSDQGVSRGGGTGAGKKEDF
eukprot:g16926.t1